MSADADVSYLFNISVVILSHWSFNCWCLYFTTNFLVWWYHHHCFSHFITLVPINCSNILTPWKGPHNHINYLLKTHPILWKTLQKRMNISDLDPITDTSPASSTIALIAFIKLTKFKWDLLDTNSRGKLNRNTPTVSSHLTLHNWWYVCVSPSLDSGHVSLTPPPPTFSVRNTSVGLLQKIFYFSNKC